LQGELVEMQTACGSLGQFARHAGEFFKYLSRLRLQNFGVVGDAEQLSG
jgi:hypothetical protein